MQETHANFGYNPRTATILNQLIIVDQLLTGRLDGLSEYGRQAELLLKMSETKTKGDAAVNTEQAAALVKSFIDNRHGEKLKALILAFGWTAFTRILAALRSFEHSEEIRDALLREPKNQAYIETTEEFIAGLLSGAYGAIGGSLQQQPYDKPRTFITTSGGEDKRRLLSIHINFHQTVGVFIDPSDDGVTFRIANKPDSLFAEGISEKQIYELLLIAMRSSWFNGALFPYNTDVQDHLSSEPVDSVTFSYDIVDRVTFMPCNL